MYLRKMIINFIIGIAKNKNRQSDCIFALLLNAYLLLTLDSTNSFPLWTGHLVRFNDGKVN
jgi:hypothetical protein